MFSKRLKTEIKDCIAFYKNDEFSAAEVAPCLEDDELDKLIKTHGKKRVIKAIKSLCKTK